MSWLLFDLNDEANLRSVRFGSDVASYYGFNGSPKGGSRVSQVVDFIIWLSSAVPSKVLGCGGQPDAKHGRGDVDRPTSIGSSLGNVPAF